MDEHERPLDLSGEPSVLTKESLMETLAALKKQAQLKGLPPVESPPLFAPPAIWEARQAAIDAGDYERAALIEAVIYRANGY